MIHLRFLGVAPLLAFGAVAQSSPAVPAQPVAPVARADDAAVRVQRSFGEVARAVRPSVVTVRSYVRLTAEEQAIAEASAKAQGWVEGAATDYAGYRLAGSGSGFFADDTGDVLTCHHALQRETGALADLFDIELVDGSRVLCEVVATEPTVNLGILHTMVFPNGHSRAVPPLRFGDSDALECGQWMLGFGDPAGPEKFFAPGTFIALPSRDCYQDQLAAFHLQVAMVAHPGAYGGPVVDLAGNVVGVLTPVRPLAGGKGLLPGQGIEFAQPSKIVTGLYESLRQARSFASPWLGFAVMSRAEIATQRGLEAFQALPKPRAGILIENVFGPSPATAVGVQPGDWLVAFGGTRIFTPVDFQKCLYLSGIGSKVDLEFWRGGQTLLVTMLIEQRPAQATPR